MINIISIAILGHNKYQWEILNDDEDEGIVIRFPGSPIEFVRGLSIIKEFLKNGDIKWLLPSKPLTDNWIVDLDILKKEFQIVNGYKWLHGKTLVKPQFSINSTVKMVKRAPRGTSAFDNMPQPELEQDSNISFTIIPSEIESNIMLIDFPELSDSFKKFQIDHPNSLKSTFIMMNFKDTEIHKEIFKTIRKTCLKYGIKALRADDKEYAEDLLTNVRTYMHGCGFGIAVFEKLTKKEFNPNVSLEVGYMMAFKKPICLLKDSTLTGLQTDLTGRLYEKFDIIDIKSTIPTVLEKWMRDKHLI